MDGQGKQKGERLCDKVLQFIVFQKSLSRYFQSQVSLAVYSRFKTDSQTVRIDFIGPDPSYRSVSPHTVRLPLLGAMPLLQPSASHSANLDCGIHRWMLVSGPLYL